MKKLLLIILCVVFSCSPKITQSPSPWDSAVIIELYNQMFSKEQFDSICIADTLSTNFNDWGKIQFINDETEALETEYTFIKGLFENEIIYRAETTNKIDSIRVTKRIKTLE